MINPYHQLRKRDNELNTKYPQNNVFIQGIHCTLESIKWDIHGQNVVKNINHQSVWRYLPSVKNQYPKTRKQMEQFFQNSPCEVYVVKKIGDDECLGLLSLDKVQLFQQVVRFGFGIFSRQCQGKTLVTQSMYLLINYAFEKLNFNKCSIRCHSLNRAAIWSVKRMGFHYQGKMRSHQVQDGRYRDSVYFSILKRQWPELKKQYQRWLDESNFNSYGYCKTKLNCKQIGEQLRNISK